MGIGKRLRTLGAVGALVLLAGMANAAAGPPTEPMIELDQPEATCAADGLTFTASATANVDVTSFRSWVVRWDHTTAAEPDWFDRLDEVEIWEAVLAPVSSRRSSVPTTHTLDTGNRATWSIREVMTGHEESWSDLFVVGARAYAPGKGSAGGAWAVADWAIDCSALGDIDPNDFIPFNHPTEVGWFEEQGNL